MSDIEDLQKKVDRLRDQLSSAYDSLHAALVRDCGFTKGEVVDVGSRRTTERGIVIDFKFRDYGGKAAVIPIVAKITKSGKPHASATLWVWELADVHKLSGEDGAE